MSRAIRFFALIMLRAAAVFTLVIWGLSQIQTVGVIWNIDGGVCEVFCEAEGYSAAAVRGPTTQRRFFRHDSDFVEFWPVIVDNRTRYHSLPGFHIWRLQGRFYLVGVTYPAALISILLCAFVIQRRNRRKGLKRRLSE